MNSARTMPCVFVLPPRSKWPGFQRPRHLRGERVDDLLEVLLLVRLDALLGESEPVVRSFLRFQLISLVVSVVSGPRRSASKSGRKNGSKRRSSGGGRAPAREIRLSRRLPVSGGGSPKPGPGFEGCRVGSPMCSLAAAASRSGQS